MADDVADFWFDPACPWAWMTSRWMDEVAKVRNITVNWHVMSLTVLNEDSDDISASYRASLATAMAPVRLINGVREVHGQEYVKPLYDAIGTRYHPQGRRDEQRQVLIESVAEVGLPAEAIDLADSEAHDESLRASHDRGIGLVGQDVGTPIVAFNGIAFFGPVVTPAPRGEEAGKLWDAVVQAAGFEGFFELKRTRTRGPIFD